MHEEELLNGWLPYRMIIEQGSVKFRWFYAGTRKFTEPFFQESVSACLSLPENSRGTLPVTSAETLIELASQVQMIPLSGFIYHISRCGSTLLSQMLVCDPHNVVLSEVPLLDDVLRLRFRKEEKSNPPIAEMFGAVLALLGQKRNASEQRLFVKTDSWHVLFYDELRNFSPAAPAFLVFRSPKEVAASHALAPAMQAVPGLLEAELFGLDETEVLYMDRSIYLERVLCAYLRKYKAILDSGDSAVGLDYHSGAWEMMQQVFNKCGYIPDLSVMNEMKGRMNFHSKKPESSFTGDTQHSLIKHNFAEAEKLFAGLQKQIAD